MLIIPWMIALKKNKDVIVKEKTEYIDRVIRDTFEIEKPVPKIITLTKIDTFQVNESIFAEIPIETKQYEDTIYNDSANIHYKAILSGYKASLDNLHIDVSMKTKDAVKTQIIREKQKFNFGLVGGFGYGVFQKKCDAFIGVGISYNF